MIYTEDCCFNAVRDNCKGDSCTCRCHSEGTQVCGTCEKRIKKGRQIFVMSPRFDEPERARAFCSWGCLNIWACGPTDREVNG
jgi:hypothetical protein